MDFVDFMDFLDLLDFTPVFSHVRYLDLFARAESLLCSVPQLFRTICVSSAVVLDHEVAQLAAQERRCELSGPAAMDADDDLRSEATTRVDWSTGEPLREASAAESAVPEAPEVPEVSAEPAAVPNPTEPVSAPAAEVPAAPANSVPEHEAPAEELEVSSVSCISLSLAKADPLS